MAVLIKNVRIFPMDQRGVIEDGQVLVEGNSIVYAGPLSPLAEDLKPDRVIDGRGAVALPGLINCHTHAAMTLLRGYADDLPLMRWLKEAIWPMENNLTAEDVYWGTLLCCVEMIRSGTTTFADMYFFMDHVAQAVEHSGLRAVLARGVIGTGPQAKEGLEEGAELVEHWHGGAQGRITAMLGPHAPYTCPPAFLTEVIDLSAKLDVGIHIHLAETATEVEDIKSKYGLTPIALMEKTGLFQRPVLAAHCVHIAGEEMDILAEKEVGVAHNPESNMKLASGVAPVSAMLRKGIAVGLGTDGAASNNNLDLFGEMRSAALLAKVTASDPTVLNAGEVLHMATAGGAKALGLAGVGTLAPGQRADLILVDFNKPHLTPCYDVSAHLVYSAHAHDVRMVMVDGCVLMEDHHLLHLDEEKIMAEARVRSRRLAGSVHHKS